MPYNPTAINWLSPSEEIGELWAPLIPLQMLSILSKYTFLFIYIYIYTIIILQMLWILSYTYRYQNYPNSLWKFAHPHTHTHTRTHNPSKISPQYSLPLLFSYHNAQKVRYILQNLRCIRVWCIHIQWRRSTRRYMGTGHGHGGKNVVIWRIQFFIFGPNIFVFVFRGQNTICSALHKVSVACWKVNLQTIRKSIYLRKDWKLINRRQREQWWVRIWNWKRHSN